jgi:hypothetical protein
MNKLYIFLVVLATNLTSHAQNIYSGGNGDGFSFQDMGFALYSGGSGSGFSFASYTAPTNPLPLTFLSFTAQPQGNAVTLHWQTANAVNVDHFDIERSANAGVFTYLTSVAAENNNANTQDYQALDPSPVTGRNDYRLKEVDAGGLFQYSNIVSVTFNGPSSSAALSVYPNPATQTLTITVTLTSPLQGIILIYNAGGQPVAKQATALPQGTSSFLCAIGSLPAGEYFIKIQGSDLPVAPFLKQ